MSPMNNYPTKGPYDLGHRASGFEVRVLGFGFRILGFRVWGLGILSFRA